MSRCNGRQRRRKESQADIDNALKSIAPHAHCGKKKTVRFPENRFFAKRV